MSDRLSRMMGLVVLVAAALSGSVRSQAGASEGRIDLVRDVDIEQRLGAKLPLEVDFLDEHGRATSLAELLGERPAILALVYYECPMLCNEVLNGLLETLRALPLELGQDFEIVMLSIDPLETPELARRKRDAYLEQFGREVDERAWHALTGAQASIDALASAVGFRYRYDPEIDEYAHGAAIYVVTPDGRLARYLYGIEYAPRDLRLALVEASDGKIGGWAEKVMMLCYHYDPLTGKYGFAIMNTVRALGLLTVGLIAGFLCVSLRREKRRRQLPLSEPAAEVG